MLPLDGVTKDMRASGKDDQLCDDLRPGPARAVAAAQDHARRGEGIRIERYFERFSRVREYLDSMVAFAREHGYVQTIFNRRRYIPELRERNFNIRAFGERTAANSPIQGSAADLIKVAMIHIHRDLAERKMESAMLLQVHDELVFEVPPSERNAVAELVKHAMENAAELSVPLVVDLGEGKNWLATKMDD